MIALLVLDLICFQFVVYVKKKMFFGAKRASLVQFNDEKYFFTLFYT